MRNTLFLSGLLLLTGCAGGPTKDYYNPAIVGAQFIGPVTMTLTDTPKADADQLVREGYTIIGTSSYMGKYAEAKELKAQARRVGANRVVYGARFVPAPPGSWSFKFGPGNFGSGGSSGGNTDMYIIFLGK